MWVIDGPEGQHSKPPNDSGQQQRSTTELGDGGQRRILYLIGATGLAALAIVVACLSCAAAPRTSRQHWRARDAPWKVSLLCRTWPTTPTFQR